MSNPYEHAVQPILESLVLDGAGVGFVLAPPTQQSLVAQAIADKIEGAIALPLLRCALSLSNRAIVLAGLPDDEQEAAEVLGTINSLRSRLKEMGLLVVLVVSHFEYDQVQRHAGDALSTRLFLENIPFVPQAGDETEARQSLASWLREHFGRLDLRGFARSEREEVSWRIEDIFQGLRADIIVTDSKKERPVDPFERHDGPGGAGLTDAAKGNTKGGQNPGNWDQIARDIVDSLSVNPAPPPGPLLALVEGLNPGCPTILLGHPGAGKSFFLRWLALRTVSLDEWCGHPRPFPLFISLAAFLQRSPLRGLIDYISDWLLLQRQPAAHLLPTLIQQGRVLFLLDGLDEGDERSRLRLVDTIQHLIAAAPACRFIVTSRVSGYSDAPLQGDHLILAPFDDSAIQGFLVRWCELYELQLRGDSELARQQGKQQGQLLAQEILGHPRLLELARTPLLLTVLALVQRAGLQIPDHRVELYDHALRILVERWNRTRSLAPGPAQPPLKTADAARLLGPVALAMIEQGARTISTRQLRTLLDTSILRGTIKGVGSADEAIDLFKKSLGLLVEQGPEVFAFLHLTLAEYLAARELIRTGKLEELATSPREAFLPEWRESLLLAAGELGLLRADDDRLGRLIDALCQSASRRKGTPSPAVPALLVGLLLDDPSLSQQSAEQIIQELVPKWWFQRKYMNHWALVPDVADACSRLKNNRWRGPLLGRVSGAYAGESSVVLQETSFYRVFEIANMLLALDIDYSEAVLRLVEISQNRSPFRFSIPHRFTETVKERINFEVRLPTRLFGSLIENMLFVEILFSEDTPNSPQVFPWFREVKASNGWTKTADDIDPQFIWIGTFIHHDWATPGAFSSSLRTAARPLAPFLEM